MNERLPKYDFGTRQDEINDDGDIVAVEPEMVMDEQPTDDELVELYDQRPPIVVNLADRALALEGIMEYLNKANKTHGSATLMDNGGGEFAKRYGSDAPEVQQGAQRNTNKLADKFRRGIAVLAATDALRANGYDEADVEVAYAKMQVAINKSFGVGKAYAKDRQRVVKKAARAADHLK